MGVLGAGDDNKDEVVGQRVFGCELIQQMGILLRMPQVVTSTAQVMFHRFGGVQKRVRVEGTHLMVPWFQRPIIFDVRAKPRMIQAMTGSQDLQMVSITLRVLSLAGVGAGGVSVASRWSRFSSTHSVFLPARPRKGLGVDSTKRSSECCHRM